MKRGFLIFILSLIICGYVVSCAFSKDINDEIYGSVFTKKELMNDLAFAEKQVFDTIFEKKDMTDRLEKLEIAVFGALQDGEEELRIKKLRKAVTNVASGGNGLNNISKITNLAGSIMGSGSWAIGNMHNFSPYTNSYYPKSGLPRHMTQHHSLYRNSYRLPPPPPPPEYNSYYKKNPITNGDFSRNYSIGTNIKILDD